MSEFGGRAERGRVTESDRDTKRRSSGDWSKSLISRDLGEGQRPNTDSLRECEENRTLRLH